MSKSSCESRPSEKTPECHLNEEINGDSDLQDSRVHVKECLEKTQRRMGNGSLDKLEPTFLQPKH